MTKILIDEDSVTTLAELATELKRSRGWKSWIVDGGSIEFTVEEDGKDRRYRIEPSGFAYDAETEEEAEEHDVNWDEEFDGWSNHVWAEDEKGNVVMLHD